VQSASSQAEREVEPLAQALGRALASARLSAQMTQVVAARVLRVSQSRLAKLETGRRRLTYLEAVRIARAYDVPVGSFESAIGSVDPDAPPES
jgi:transcriptional regulator with XRE-family HTH domain